MNSSDAPGSADLKKVGQLSMEFNKPGLLGAILGRAEAQAIRLALVYAPLNGSSEIQLPHLRTAFA